MIEVKAKKLTDVELLRRANSFTTRKESEMTLKKAYKLGHSPIRTQMFWVEIRNLPLYVASQLVRAHVGIQFFQLSKRPDRGGENFIDVCENIFSRLNSIDTDDYDAKDSIATDIRGLPYRFDRFAPTDLAFICNAESLINISRERLCRKASIHTQDVWRRVAIEIGKVDHDLFDFLVPSCVHTGLCRESKPCGFMLTDTYKKSRKKYKEMFNGNA